MPSVRAWLWVSQLGAATHMRWFFFTSEMLVVKLFSTSLCRGTHCRVTCREGPGAQARLSANVWQPCSCLVHPGCLHLHLTACRGLAAQRCAAPRWQQRHPL